MKKIFVYLILAASFQVNATSITEVQKELEGTSIRAIDWYKKGDTYFAESTNHSRLIEVSLADNKWLMEIKLVKDITASDFEIWGIGSCYRLAKFVPHKTGGWGKTTPDDKLINSVFDRNIAVSAKNEAMLNGWQLKMERPTHNKLSCSVIKQ